VAAVERVDLTGAPATMLATLYGRALDSRLPNSVLHDDEAARTVERIEYDFASLRMRPTTSVGVAIRAKQLDDWTREFLAEHPSATVLHLACGLDTRVHRLAPGPNVRWYDVDYPDVVALRERLLTPPSGDYHLVASSVTESAWLDAVPADRPTVAVFEGLTMYLTADEVRSLITRVCGRFSSGQLLFDCYGTLGIKLQKLNPPVRKAGATLHWGTDNPYELQAWHKGLRCLDILNSVDMPGLDHLPKSGQVAMKVMSYLPGFKDIGKILRFAFSR
jgi:O-methyltransferase involved in polyketide biosynthesis